MLITTSSDSDYCPNRQVAVTAKQLLLNSGWTRHSPLDPPLLKSIPERVCLKCLKKVFLLSFSQSHRPWEPTYSMSSPYTSPLNKSIDKGHCSLKVRNSGFNQNEPRPEWINNANFAFQQCTVTYDGRTSESWYWYSTLKFGTSIGVWTRHYLRSYDAKAEREGRQNVFISHTNRNLKQLKFLRWLSFTTALSQIGLLVGLFKFLPVCSFLSIGLNIQKCFP